jgi:hypothetical protein
MKYGMDRAMKWNRGINSSVLVPACFSGWFEHRLCLILADAFACATGDIHIHARDENMTNIPKGSISCEVPYHGYAHR